MGSSKRLCRCNLCKNSWYTDPSTGHLVRGGCLLSASVFDDHRRNQELLASRSVGAETISKAPAAIDPLSREYHNLRKKVLSSQFQLHFPNAGKHTSLSFSYNHAQLSSNPKDHFYLSNVSCNEEFLSLEARIHELQRDVLNDGSRLSLQENLAKLRDQVANIKVTEWD